MSVRERWDAFWFRQAAPHDLIAARVIVALTTLWLVASRPLLPEIVRWPAPLWKHANGFIRARYLIVPLPFAVEMALYIVLAAALICVALGVAVRVSAFAAALLAYHFAPMEDIFAAWGGPFFRGFTLPILALLILAFARTPRRDDPPSDEYRWPVILMQLLLAFTYLLSGLSKLRIGGLAWITARNFESIVLAMMIPGSVPPWAHWFLGHPILCFAGALVGIGMDLFFIVAVFSRKAARVIVPLTFVAHLLIIRVLGVVFLVTPMLLLFVNWEWVASKFRRPSSVSTR